MNHETPHLPALALETPEPLKACSKELRSCLSEGSDYEGAVQAICSSRAMTEELRALMPAIQAAARPADELEIFQIVAELMPHFGIRDLTPEQNASLMEPYLDGLKGIPATALRAAKMSWIKGELYPNDIGRHAFMPKAVELRKLAEPRIEKLWKASFRAKKALEAKPQGPRGEKTPEEIAEVKRMLAELKGSLRSMPDEGRPSSSKHEVAERLRRAAEAGKS